MAVPFSLGDCGVVVAHMTRWTQTETELEKGEVVLSVNGERCRGADDARRMLRDTCTDKNARLVLQVWRPPEDFVHAEGDDEGSGAGDEREEGVVGAEAVVKGRGLELRQRQGGAGAGAEDRGASVARGVGAAQGVDVGPGAGVGGSD